MSDIPHTDFSGLLGELNGGVFEQQLNRALSDVAANVCTCGKDGEVVITLKVTQIADSSQALAAIREISIEAKKNVTSTDRDFGASKSSLEEIEARAKGGLPTHLLFSCTAYPGFKPRQFLLRLSVITGDTPVLKLRIVGKEQAEEDIAQEFKTLLQDQIGESAALTIGKFSP